MKLFALLCGLSVGVSMLVGCSAPAGDEATGDSVAESQADLAEGEGTGSATGGYDPTVTKPVAWACNFQSGRSAVFVQARVHSPYGTLTVYDGWQDPNGNFDTLNAGSGQTATTVTNVKFAQEAMFVTFANQDHPNKFVMMNVDLEEKLRIKSRTYPWTARFPAEELDDMGGCWGVR